MSKESPPNPLLAALRQAPWRTAAEAAAFGAGASAELADLLGALELLTHRNLAQDHERHALRFAAYFAMVQRRPDEALVRPIVRALKGAPADVQRALAELLRHLPVGNELADLVEHLRSSDSDLRAASARALCEIGGKQVLQAVAALTSERGFVGMREALDVVVRVGGAHALTIAERVLQAGDVPDKQHALRALCDPALLARASAPVLRLVGHAVRDGNDAVAGTALQCLSTVASEAEYHAVALALIDGRNLKLASAALDGLKRYPTERTAQILERRLAVGPNVLRFHALSVVESAASDVLLAPLVKALGHPTLAIRNRAAEVMSNLSRSGKVEIGRSIVWLLRSTNVTVRRMAAEVLRSVKDPHGELWPKLISSLRDDDWWVRERVMDALVELAGRGLSRYMLAWLQDPSDVVRRFALGVLARLRDPETIGALVKCAMSDKDWWAREKAVEVIAGFKDARAVPTIVDIMHKSPEMQLACIDALQRIDLVTATPHIVGLAGAEESDVRLAVLRFLEELNDPAQAVVVDGLKSDPDPQVQRLARALALRWSMLKSKGNADLTAPPALIVQGDNTPLDAMLMRVVELGADDLIIASDRPAFMKRAGGVAPLTDVPVAADRVTALLTPLLSTAQALRLESKKDVDFSYVVKASGHRFRVNLFRQRGGLSAVFHAVRGTIPVLEQLGLPPSLSKLCEHKNGLVLVAGPTASGKSTTLAAFVDYINRTSARHIVSIEDPIEVIHPRKRSLVNQREVGTHTRSFAAALKSALREDPDVLMIGELRDLATIQLALTAAETGHLVFGTMNTTSSEQALERIISTFPRLQQDQARSGLADVLRAVVCQVLVRGRDGSSRHAAVELLLNNEAVANLVRKGKTLQIPSILATSADQGMQSIDQDVQRLVRQGVVDPDDASWKIRHRAVAAAIGAGGSGPVPSAGSGGS